MTVMTGLSTCQPHKALYSLPGSSLPGSTSDPMQSSLGVTTLGEILQSGCLHDSSELCSLAHAFSSIH